jgi:hypothetical protein
MITRRQLLKRSAAGAAVLAGPGGLVRAGPAGLLSAAAGADQALMWNGLSSASRDLHSTDFGARGNQRGQSRPAAGRP